ncbi:MAG: hypothetical protein ACKO11_06055 [Cuspidothrix sp.]
MISSRFSTSPKKRTDKSRRALSPSHFPKQRTACSSACAIAHPHVPKNDSYGALRYRPCSLTPKRSHPHIPQTANCLQQRLRYRRSHLPTSPQKAIPAERFAIALLTSPKSDSYGALRYRPPNISKKRTACSSACAIALSPPQKAIKVYCVCFKLSWRLLLV